MFSLSEWHFEPAGINTIPISIAAVKVWVQTTIGFRPKLKVIGMFLKLSANASKLLPFEIYLPFFHAFTNLLLLFITLLFYIILFLYIILTYNILFLSAYLKISSIIQPPDLKT